ncbi:arsenate reductase [Liquorilactobacillus ghanensis DSM 18630]|uniref:Arsenate reductase n=1 Tax=Liquorilactobacillus ghanensis DSM 18630 TaxID=1423750 RepID=A0A0R1VGR1_9LACO|nr:arsenate reductase family protein [Liquorilactobacillus ghanensis]KRM04469.1 arsenate reductase [Liquorilactobacillus ghanensis DSM 18630]
MKTFYCYNRCSTCAKARKWLQANQVEFNEIDIVKTPPTADQLLQLIELKQHPLKYFFNTSGIKYRELHLKDKIDQLDAKAASELLASDGKLIKRPLMIEGDHFTCGFKPDIYQSEWQA